MTMRSLKKLTAKLSAMTSAGVVRAAAGVPGGVRQTRRGTVLVLVLGALALISVVTLVYATIGQADRRTSGVAQGKDVADRSTSAIAEYLAQVVADDATSVYVDGHFPTSAPTNAGEPMPRREATDYPFTDPFRASIFQEIPGGDAFRNFRRFDPTGSYFDQLPQTVRDLDPRLASDPWLATIEPFALTWSGTAPQPQEMRDWRQISNFAPDGRFVNLFNLRNNFDAAQGFDASQFEISSRLTLFNPATGQPYATTAASRLPDGTQALPNVPAHWTMFQVDAFRPARETERGWDNANHSAYQWADADGDGFLDARWFEMVDAYDQNNPVSLLPRDEDFRWFIAARAIDLSGLANLNTGIDMRQPAKSTANAGEVTPHGLVPEVDLRRLFTLEDQFYAFGSGAGYQALVAPSIGDPNYSGYGRPVALAVGDASYNALRNILEMSQTQVPGPGWSFGVANLTGDQRWRYYTDLVSGEGKFAFGTIAPTTTGYRSPGPFGMADQQELFTFRGVNDPLVTSRLEQALGGRASGHDDRSPLRDNRTAAQERPLEEALRKAVFNPGSQEARASFNRSAFDIRHLLTTVSGARAIRPEILNWTQNDMFQLTRSELKIDAREALDIAPNLPPRALFEGYARALMPYMGRMNAWESRVTVPTSAPIARNRTLYFGLDPERALRTAAHLTANMLDCFDEDLDPGTGLKQHKPRSYRVQLTTTAPAVGAAPILNLNSIVEDSLATNANQVYAPEGFITVHGIEAQPFLVQATSYGFYTSDDGARPPAQIRTNIPLPNAATNPNPDYLGQILAFQLVNPFDVDLDLTDYTLEYGVESINNTNDPPVPVPHKFPLTGVLEAGKSRVFYVTTRDMQAQWSVAEPGADVQRWITNQFSGSDPDAQPPVEITLTTAVPWDFFHQLDKSTNNPLSASSASDLELKARWGSVLLWGPNTGDPTERILVDRLRDPLWETRQTPALLRRLVHSTQGYIEIQGGGDPGATIALNSALRRTPDPESLREERRGGIPAYCLEGRWNTGTPVAGVQDLRNEAEIVPTRLNTLDWSDFNAPYAGSSPTPVIGAGATTPIHDEMSEHPDSWSRPPSFATNFKTLPVLEGNDSTRLKFEGDTHFPGRYPEILLNNNEFEETAGGLTVSTLRVTDMLAPLGIGPVTVRNNNVPDDNDPYFEHLTLSEALAIATHMTTPDQTSNVNDPDYIFQPYRNVGNPAEGVLDRGNLSLETPAPFEDTNNNQQFDFNDRFQRRGTGIPLALNILNSFTTMPGESIRLDRFTPGLVNINTAPISVQRLIGLLSPTTEANGAVWNQWKTDAGLTGSDIPSMPEPPVAGASAALLSDIPAAITAYRDQQAVVDRSGRLNDYRYRSIVPTPVDPTNPALRPLPVPPTGSDDIFSGIFGLRGQLFDNTNDAAVYGAPGFASVGELLCVIRRDQPSSLLEYRKPIDHTMSGNVFGNGIDFLAHDPDLASDPPHPSGSDSGSRGMLTAEYLNESLVKDRDTLRNNYVEKLLLASGVMNSITVRSDVYAVWFVVHGYARADCEDLRPTDPLVPSVAKRYLMVIDRSNVTRRGEKPRILLMTEVPLNP